MMF
jgi:putative ABC transport system substrate-binding protein